MSIFNWAEDDFDLPYGTERLISPQPQSGRTYIMYHGTHENIGSIIKAQGFKQSSGGMLGRGVYLSRDLQKASRYPIDIPEAQRVVVKVQVNVGKVKRIDCKRHPLQKTWHDQGYDTAWVPPNCGMVRSGLEENCVWDPRRITVLRLIRPTPCQPDVGTDLATAGLVTFGLAAFVLAGLALLK